MSVATNTGGTSGGRKEKIYSQPQLPWKKSIQFALGSIKVRFWRSMITAGGVALGIAFLASVLTSQAIAGQVDAAEEARTRWLIGLSLLVCAVGITNAMLMSVSERFREIGTMKCLGALDAFVVRIFMIESVLTGVLASTIGWLVGMGAIVLVKLIAGVPKEAPAGTVWYGSLDGGDILRSFLFCIPVGALLSAIATYIPARQAASIPPAAALRIDV
ncbi:MAG: FtsX-like permease family protein [Armatimonadetes bacterium]|nr:FtsX-like permease family protein [Armatimonadota bacterium]